MNNCNIFSRDVVLSTGILFDGEHLDWGEDGYHVCRKLENGTEVQFTGLLYETIDNNLAYYQHYENGAANGVGVDFYANGNIKKYANWRYGNLHGEVTSFDENGGVCSIETYEYGILVSSSTKNVDGELVCNQVTITEQGKTQIEDFEALVNPFINDDYRA